MNPATIVKYVSSNPDLPGVTLAYTARAGVIAPGDQVPLMDYDSVAVQFGPAPKPVPPDFPRGVWAPSWREFRLWAEAHGYAPEKGE